MTTFQDDNLGISFVYGSNDTFNSGTQPNLFQAQIIPQGANPHFDCFGMVLVEDNPQLQQITFKDYMDLSLQNLKNFPDPNLVVENLSTESTTIAGLEAEKISYTMRAKSDTSGRYMSVNSTVAMKNGKGYVFQVSGPGSNFNPNAMDYVWNTVKIY